MILWKQSRSLRTGHTDSITSLAFDSDGQLLASGGLDAKVIIWNGHNGEFLRALEGPSDGIEWIAWHPRGKVVLAGSEDYSAWMFSASTGQCMQVFTGHEASVTCGGFTPDGT